MRYDSLPSRGPVNPVSLAVRQTVLRAASLAAMVALGVLLPTLVFRPLTATPAQGILDVFVRPGLYLTDLAVVAVIIFGLATWRGRGSLRGQTSLIAPLLALVGLALVAAPLALSPALASYTALRWALAVALFVALLGGNLPMRGLVAGLLAGATINAVLAIAQVIAQAPLGLPGELTLPREVSGAAVIGADRWLRPYGLAFHPNVLGGLLVVGLLAMLPWVSQLYVKLAWWLCWAALLLTVSRSAWIALALTLPLAAGWLWLKLPGLRHSLMITAAGSIVITVALLAPMQPVLSTRLASASVPAGQSADATGRSVSERMALQSVALGVIKTRPFSGIGAGNTPLAVQTSGVDAAPQPIHNLPLLFAAEVGTIGGGLWIFLWLAPLAMLLARWRGRRRRPVANRPAATTADARALPLVFALAWLALGIVGLFDFYPWGLESGRLLSVVTLALFARTFSET